MKKLIIGTAQLVNNYGVANQNDKKTKKKILEFLEFCFKNNLKCFDTAFNYGSEKIIGEFIKKNYIKNVKINSKIPSLKLLNNTKKLDFIKKNLDNSLNNLNLNTLDTVYFHDENDKDFFISNIFEIKEIFKKYKIKNLGFSIYSKKSSITSLAVTLSRFPVGSSAKIIRGCLVNTLAIEILCC